MTGTTTDPTPPPSPPTSENRPGPAMPPPRRRASWRILAVFVVLAFAFVFLLVEGLGSSLNYFDTVNQAYANRHLLGTQDFRLEGTVMPGTIQPTAAGSDFDICQGAHVVHVVNTGTPPGLFQPRIPVVVVGHFTSGTSNRFVSNSIEVKHTATYTARYPSRVKKAPSAGPVC